MQRQSSKSGLSGLLGKWPSFSFHHHNATPAKERPGHIAQVQGGGKEQEKEEEGVGAADKAPGQKASDQVVNWAWVFCEQTTFNWFLILDCFS